MNLGAVKTRLRSYKWLVTTYRRARRWYVNWCYRPAQYYLTTQRRVRGSGSRLRRNGSVLQRSVIDIAGQECMVDFGVDGVFSEVAIHMRGVGHTLVFGSDCVIRKTTFWFEDDHCLVSVGDRCTMEGGHIAVTEPSSRIEIGSDCMFSMDIDIRNGDSHSICDASTKRRINYAQDVKVGDRVWLGKGVTLLKGVQIGEDSIVGSHAVVTRSVPMNAVAAGNPARVVRANVLWTRPRIRD